MTSNLLEPENYICSILTARHRENSSIPLDNHILNTFQRIWNEVIESKEGKSISVLEPACGSANDWRFIDAFGLSAMLDYTGIDLCEKNISNARAMFKDVDFFTGNAFELEYDDNSFDYCFVSDLFEHLSEIGIKTAVEEICRVTDKQICVIFFNMSRIPLNRIERYGSYHWNELSCSVIKAAFRKNSRNVEALSISQFLSDIFGCEDMHNEKAYTLYITL